MKVKNGRETITSKIAYIAGFFDGEGCIRIKESNKGENSFYVIAHLTNSYRPVLDEVQSLFGGAVRKQERTPNKTIYNWCVSSAEAVDFLRTIAPFLKEKRRQAEYAIDFHERKGTMDGADKRAAYVTISAMKRGLGVIGNIYENPELIKS
jgi:intein/homing endonuclease